MSLPLKAFLFLVALWTVPTPASAAAPDYDRDIAPIFRSYCAGCHNADDWDGNLSLETYAQLREGGDEGDPIVEGDAAASLLTQVIAGQAKPTMPPRDEPQVPANDLATLNAWINAGAKGPAKDVSLFEHLTVPRLPPSQDAKPLTSLAYAPDGRFRAEARYGRVDVFTLPENEPILAITDLPGKVHAIHFSSDGEEILLSTGITGLKGVAERWSVTSGQRLGRYEGHRDILYDAEMSPDGRWIATAGYDTTIRIWDKREGNLVRVLDAHQGAVFDLAFHPTLAILASASADETVKLWRLTDGVRLDTLNQPQGEQVTVAFTPDGDHVLSAGADKRLHFWRLVSRSEPALNPVVHSRFAHEAGITQILCLPDGKRVLSAAADRSLKVWALPKLIELHAYEPLPDIATTLTPIPGTDTLAVACMDGSVQKHVLTHSRPGNPTATAVTAEPLTGTAHPPVDTEPDSLEERESNDWPSEAQGVTVPIAIKGAIAEPGDLDLYRFHAEVGTSLLLEIHAARADSALDSKIEILDTEGHPIEQVRLQATRDSWFTFRGKDSSTSGDFRLHNWAEMELNEYLYANGEVVRLWLYPRGPDSGYKVYPGAGKRHTHFFTTALTHPLGEPCYIVQPLPPHAEVIPNGLPVFRVYWENDDDPMRRWGTDSQLWFDPPATGDYLVRVSDVRGFGDSKDYHYTLNIRNRVPDFDISVSGKDPKVSPGSGREISFSIERHEGFEGEVAIDVAHLPQGYSMTSPVIIEAGQQSAIGVLRAEMDAADPDHAADSLVALTATAHWQGRDFSKPLGDLGNIQKGDPAKVTVEILPLEEQHAAPATFSIRPGETIRARVRATRHDFEGRIALGNEDSGRNLPHGLYVDNIGLNGLLIVEGQTEREFFITAAPWVPPTTRPFHLRATADGGQASAPAIVRVLPGNDG